MKTLLIIGVVLFVIGLIGIAVTEAGPQCSKANDCVGVGK